LDRHKHPQKTDGIIKH